MRVLRNYNWLNIVLPASQDNYRGYPKWGQKHMSIVGQRLQTLQASYIPLINIEFFKLLSQ